MRRRGRVYRSDDEWDGVDKPDELDGENMSGVEDGDEFFVFEVERGAVTGNVISGLKWQQRRSTGDRGQGQGRTKKKAGADF